MFSLIYHIRNLSFLQSIIMPDYHHARRFYDTNCQDSLNIATHSMKWKAQTDMLLITFFVTVFLLNPVFKYDMIIEDPAASNGASLQRCKKALDRHGIAQRACHVHRTQCWQMLAQAQR